MTNIPPANNPSNNPSGAGPRRAIARLKPYAAGKPIEEVQRELGLSDIVKMASNENPLGPSPAAVRAAGEALLKGHLYPDANNYYLKEAIAAHWDLPGDWVLPGNGADEIIRLLAECYLEPGDEVVIAPPTFSYYEIAALLMEARVRTVPTVNWRMDLSALAGACGERTKLLFLCNPNNPTGTMLTHSEVADFLEQVPPTVLVVLDEAYAEFVDHPGFPRSLEFVRGGLKGGGPASCGKNVLIMKTFSKIFGLAGLRLGYALARPEILAPLAAARDPFSVNLPAQAAGIAALGDTEHVAKTRELNRQGKEYLYRELERLGLGFVPTQSNFILIGLGRPARPVYEALLRRGVIVRLAESFGLPSHIRVTVGRLEDNRRFIGDLEDILRAGQPSQGQVPVKD